MARLPRRRGDPATAGRPGHGRTLGDMTIPDSAIARAATDLLTAASPTHLVNHCLRTYHFGLEIADGRGWRPDRELFYLAAALHDLGLTERFDGPDAFELEGAAAAHALLVKHGYDRADLVAEAIRVHIDLATAKDPRPEVALVHIGAGVDVTGARLDRIDADAVARILDAYPRLGFKKAVAELLSDQARRKPGCAAANLVSLGALELIEAAPFDS